MEASDLTGHISRRFNKDIEDLRSTVLTMGGVVEAQLARAIAAIVSGDSEQVHRATCTTRHRVICETGIDPDDLEDHIIAWADR